ncbi:MAG: bifunctional methylenetetrahydrofolate dehydrogenase/methenyltetrahydrofolate cyclohydrolase FolD [Polyangiaceae bacterium]|nr:bifunctional methylenetetrahydrofolate dehydrogenase/methenyltetrahydrofolate cyclohydrolase FolD [Polyangiaceae bacterium]
MATILDGKAIAKLVRGEVARETETFRARTGRAPGLHVVLAGEDPGSVIYVRNKEKAAAEVGFAGRVHRRPSTVTEQELLELVGSLNQDEAVDGILVQMPVPSGIRGDRVIATIDPSKDVDGLHPVNAGALWSGSRGLVPCTPLGCMRLLKEAGAVLRGARALVVGRSNLVGKPTAALLLAEHATVTIAHSRTADLEKRCREADILVAAVGRPRMIRGAWIKPGAVVLDVGMNRGDDGKLCGDVEFETAKDVAAVITPVPGGVGPMTIAMLLGNTLRAAQAREGLC